MLSLIFHFPTQSESKIFLKNLCVTFVECDTSLYQKERFLLSQIFILSLKGIPAFYFQALLGSKNDTKTF